MPEVIAETIPAKKPKGLNQTNSPAPHPQESRGEPSCEIRRLCAEISTRLPFGGFWFLLSAQKEHTVCLSGIYCPKLTQEGQDMGQTANLHRELTLLRRSAGMGMALTVLFLLLPGMLISPMEPAEETQTIQPISAAPSAQQTQSGVLADQDRIVRLLRSDGRVEELTMADYLWGVVAAEMPAAFHSEALKAQAAAARTYTVGLQDSPSSKHETAHLCDNSGCCQAYTDRETAQLRWGLQAAEYTDKITQAVTGTDGLGVLYDSSPIQAVFFSAAAGRTVDAVEVWGNAVSYLKSVESPEGEEVPNYHSQVTLTVEEVRQKITARYPGADLSLPPEQWFTQIIRTDAGSVSQITAGGITLTGSQARLLFSLRSASFSVSCQDGNFVFDVTGYGHGVGMSQYGANAMAAEGADFREILTWYYTGTEIGPLW